MTDVDCFSLHGAYTLIVNGENRTSTEFDLGRVESEGL